MNKNSKRGYFILGGTILAAGVGGLLYAWNKHSHSSDGSQIGSHNLDRQTVIAILKELRKEMYSVFTNFSMVSMQIKQQTMGRARPEEIKMMLLEQPMFKGEIESVEDIVYANFGTSKEQFQQVCELQYSEDIEVRALQQDMKDSFDKSFQGIAPESKTEIPEFLTPEITFQILEKVMLQSAIKLNVKLLEFKESGEEINFNNPKLMQVVQSLKMDSSKKEVLAEFGLDKFEESAQKILQYATQQYTIQNKNGFAERMQRLDVKYQGAMEQLLMNGPMTEAQLTGFMQADIPQQNMPFGGMGAGLRMRKGQSQPEEVKEQPPSVQRHTSARDNEDSSSQKNSAKTEEVKEAEPSHEKPVEPTVNHDEPRVRLEEPHVQHEQPDHHVDDKPDHHDPPHEVPHQEVPQKHEEHHEVAHQEVNHEEHHEVAHQEVPQNHDQGAHDDHHHDH